MANYLVTSLFFCDKSVARTNTMGMEEIRALLDSGPPRFRASSRHGDCADRIAAMLMAKGSNRSYLEFVASKGKWPSGPWAGVLPFEEMLPIAESIDGLLAWSAESIPTVTRILDADSAEEIREALRTPEISARPNDEKGADSDGLGARFLFSYLASIASVAREAHCSGQALICFRG